MHTMIAANLAHQAAWGTDYCMQAAQVTPYVGVSHNHMLACANVVLCCGGQKLKSSAGARQVMLLCWTMRHITFHSKLIV